MKINKIMQECRKLITPEIKRNVELSVFIADRILDLLESTNMTQRQLAAKLGKSESEISTWLTGTHTFTTKTIAKIEIALGEHIFQTNKVVKPQIVVKVNSVYENKRTISEDSWLPMHQSEIDLNISKIENSGFNDSLPNRFLS